MGNCASSPKIAKDTIFNRSLLKQENSAETKQDFDNSICFFNISSLNSEEIKFDLPADKEKVLLPVVIPKGINILLTVTGAWEFLPEKGLTTFQGYQNIKYQNFNVGQLMCRLSGQSPFPITKNNFCFTSPKEKLSQIFFYGNCDPVTSVPKEKLKIILKGQFISIEKKEINQILGWDKIRREEGKEKNDITEIIELINKARTNPKKFAEEYIDKSDPFYAETYQMLTQYTPVGLLKKNEVLNLAARDHCYDLNKSGSAGHLSSDGRTIKERIKKYSKKDPKYFGENYSFRYKRPYSIVLSMLADNNLRSKPNRNNILNPEFTDIGVEKDHHSIYELVCVIVFGKNIE